MGVRNGLESLSGMDWNGCPEWSGIRNGFILLDILAVAPKEAKKIRLDDETPYLKFSKATGSSNIAILEVTKDF